MEETSDPHRNPLPGVTLPESGPSVQNGEDDGQMTSEGAVIVPFAAGVSVIVVSHLLDPVLPPNSTPIS